MTGGDTDRRLLLLSEADNVLVATSRINFLLAIGFQAWSRGFTPRDIVGYWLPIATNAPIAIGDVAIASGDYMVGDRDGLVRVPMALAEEVVEKTEAAMATESLVRKAILAGADPQQAYLKYGKF